MVAQTKVFVGGLPTGSKPEDLRRLFERYGEVVECDIMNRCGFVHMSTEEEAAAAIRGIQNVNFNGSVITVEKGRIKERGGPRGGGGPPRGGGPMRGGMRNGMGDMPRRPGGGGPMRGPPMGGGRDGAPYMRDRPPMRGGDMRGPMGGMRNGMGGGGGYDAYPEDRFNGGGYGNSEDRWGGGGYGGMMDRGGRPDVGYGGGAALRGDIGYGSSVGGGGGMYPDDRRGGYGGMDDRAPLYPDERRAAPMYPDELDMMDRRAGAGMRPAMSMAPAYDRVPAARSVPMGNGDIYSRRSPTMHGGAGYVDREPYGQQYPPMGGGRMGGGPGPRGGRDMDLGARRY